MVKNKRCSKNPTDPVYNIETRSKTREKANSVAKTLTSDMSATETVRDPGRPSPFRNSAFQFICCQSKANPTNPAALARAEQLGLILSGISISEPTLQSNADVPYTADLTAFAIKVREDIGIRIGTKKPTALG